MNTQQIENQEIWKQIKGAEKLFEIYSYFPTLHDATIRDININLEKKEFYLTVNYSDLVKESNHSVLSQFTICWRNVQKADFNWNGEDLYGITFSKASEFIRTKFKDYSFGFDGKLISSEIEVTDVEIELEKDKNNQGNTIKFSIN